MNTLKINKKLTVLVPFKNFTYLAAEVKTGDILICAGTSSLGKAISSCTDSEVTHVGLLYVWDGVIYVIEAVDTLREVPLSFYKQYDGRLFIGRISGNKHFPTYSERHSGVKGLITIAKSDLGKGYDYDDLVKIALNRSWFGKIFKFRKDDDTRMYCSDAICHVLREYYSQPTCDALKPEALKPLLVPSRYSLPSEIAAICDIYAETACY